MKKAFILLLLSVFLLASCTFDIDTSAAAERKKIEQMSPKIIRCLTQRDKEALTGLFCSQIQNRPDFADEIDKAFKYFECDLYWGTRTIHNSAGGGKSKDNGRVTSWFVWPQIDYIATFVYVNDSETIVRVYNINYKWMIFNQDKSIEGLQYITIELVNVDSFTLGENIDQ